VCLLGSWPVFLVAAALAGRTPHVGPRDFAVTPSVPETRASLIVRLCDGADAAAWDEVVAVYGPLVYRLARQKGLQPADADDLVQVVLAAVARSIEKWLERSDRGRFRAWLLTIARNTAINFLTRPKHRPLATGGSDAANELASVAAPEEASQNGSGDFDVEYRRQVFRWASNRLQQTMAEKTWQAFWQTTMEDRPIAEVATQLEMTVGSVYIARSRVMTRLRAVVQQFEENDA